tara:strand:- start:49 stop:273 length:225 start_codon:yes stop_codon:yes gene_type:complete
MIIDPFLNNPKTLYFKKFMSNQQNDELLENLFEQEVERSIQKLKELGFKDIQESDLDKDSIAEKVQKQFEDLCQ